MYSSTSSNDIDLDEKETMGFDNDNYMREKVTNLEKELTAQKRKYEEDLQIAEHKLKLEQVRSAAILSKKTENCIFNQYKIPKRTGNIKQFDIEISNKFVEMGTDLPVILLRCLRLAKINCLSPCAFDSAEFYLNLDTKLLKPPAFFLNVTTSYDPFELVPDSFSNWKVSGTNSDRF